MKENTIQTSFSRIVEDMPESDKCHKINKKEN
jgi:hypothetical protein